MPRIKLNEKIGLDLDDLVRTRLLIQGNSGSGKSWLLKRICEQGYGKIQQIIIDLEGEFAPLRDRFDYVLVGESGDVPIKVKFAKLLAERIMSVGFSAIIDLSEFEKDDREEFLSRFLRQLLATPVKDRRPCLVAIDEAHIFCPQTGEAKSSKAVVDLMTRGRKRGLCGILLTQRISKIHKDATAEINNKLIGRTFQDVDQKRAASELGFSRERMLRLRNLKPGEFFAFGSALSAEVQKIKIGGLKTHHPGPGQITSYKPPSPGTAIKKLLKKIGDIPQEHEDRLTADKIKDDEIQRLLRENRLLRTEKPGPTKEQIQEAARVAIGLAEKKLEGQCREILQKIKLARDSIVETFEQMASDATKKLVSIEFPEIHLQTPEAKVIKPVPINPNNVNGEYIKASRPIRETPGEVISGDKLSKAPRKMLEVLVQRAPLTFTKSQLSLASGYSIKSSTFANGLSTLYTRGYLNKLGNELSPTQAGLDYFGVDLPKPQTVEERISMWRSKLGNGFPGKLFNLLVSEPERSFSKEEISNSLGYSTYSSTFANGVSLLNRNGLLEKKGEYIKASEELFI